MAGSVPDNVHDVLEDVGLFVPQGGISDEAMVVYERMMNRKCMHCETPLGADSCVVVNHLGVVMAFCGQVCMIDMTNMHYLSELYDDLSDAAKFRNASGKADEA